MYGWSQLIKECSSCNNCDLSSARNNVVIGRGNKAAPMMLIGEGPGAQEDIQGLPFVGAAGQLLDLLLRAQNISCDQYYIANIVKCRPPGNRIPLEEEAQGCLPFLRKQFKLIDPKIVVCLGGTAVKYIIDKDAKITKIRGNWIEKKECLFMPTFHPAALLRDESKKILMWQDFKKVKEKLKEMIRE